MSSAARARSEAEVAVLGRFSTHPYIIHVHHAFYGTRNTPPTGAVTGAATLTQHLPTQAHPSPSESLSSPLAPPPPSQPLMGLAASSLCSSTRLAATLQSVLRLLNELAPHSQQVELCPGSRR